MRISSVAATLVVLAGSGVSLAQPVIDGSRDLAPYGAPRWVQSLPTTFGDNRANLCQSVGNRVTFALDNSNAAGVGGVSTIFDNTDAQFAAAQAVATGIEIRIPLSELGNPTGAIRIAGFVNNGSGNYLSNQVIGGFNLPAGSSRGNLGGDLTGGFTGSLSGIDFNNNTQCPGNQFITVPFSNAPVTAPTIDGTRDASYGTPLWTQNVGTGFGNGTNFGAQYNSGSELDALYGYIGTADVGNGPQQYLFLFIAGNIETANNFGSNRVQLFIDTGAATGLNQIVTPPAVDGITGSAGLTFDAGFKASYYMAFSAGYQDALAAYRAQAAFARLDAGVQAGGIIGAGDAQTAVVGTPTVCPPDPVVCLGSEIDAVYSVVHRPSRTLNVMVTGNLRLGDFIALFFDANGNPAGDAGQNRVNGPGSQGLGERSNPNIGIADGGNGSLNRCGYDGTSGLTFDTDFSADYFLNCHLEAGNRFVIDASVLRTGGRLEDFNSFPLDYGSYTGFSTPTVVGWDGGSFDQALPATGVGGFPGSIQVQDGLRNQILSHFPPRESTRVLQGYLTRNNGNYPPSNLPDGTNPVWTDWLGVTNNGNPTAAGANPPAPLPRSGLIRARLDNSNLVGVTELSGAGGASPTFGFEFSINLDELGYNPRSRIRVAGFLVNNNFTVVSNQVLGDPFASATANLGDPRNINFASDGSGAGRRQWVQLSSCVADYNNSGNVDVNDIFAFLGGWFARDQLADTNTSGVTDVNDIFAFLGLWFQGACL